jgi:hypothetical protein
MRRGLCAAAAAVVVALSTAPVFIAPAGAQSGPTVTASPLTLTPTPNSAGNVATNNLSVSGHFHVAGGLQPTFNWVSVNLSWRGKAPGPPVPGPYTICGTPPSGTPPAGPACSPGADEDFKNSPLVPGPAYNGPYRVNATGKATDGVGQSDTQSTSNIDFAIAAPPPNVTGVTAAVNKDRSVTVSFDRDAVTPDVQSYWIYRKGPGETDFKPRLQTAQQASGARLSVPDPGPANAGGDYLYQVETHRNGATGDNASFVVSDRTKSQSNKVTVANPPPGATTVPPPPPSSDGAPPVVKGTPSGVTRNSGFSSPGSSPNTTPTSEAVTPDPGFERGLPYAAGSPAPDNSNSNEGDNSAVAVTPGRHKSNSRGIFVPVAAGALLFVGAFHLRILKKRLDEPPSTGLTAV